MTEPKLINIYDLPEVPNICNQRLREVISLPNLSMAHVVMKKGNVSLWHKHQKTSEIYFILNGKGILSLENMELQVNNGVYATIFPNTAHRLENTTESELKHLVFAVPPFDSKDIEILNKYKPEDEIIKKKLKYKKEPIIAEDSALVYELMTSFDRERLNVSLAVGSLPSKRKAISHFHKISEEIYYVISGRGKIHVGEKVFDVRRNSVVYVPVENIHSLENTSETKELEVLCVSSPAYTGGDFIFA